MFNCHPVHAITSSATPCAAGLSSTENRQNMHTYYAAIPVVVSLLPSQYHNVNAALVHALQPTSIRWHCVKFDIGLHRFVLPCLGHAAESSGLQSLLYSFCLRRLVAHLLVAEQRGCLALLRVPELAITSMFTPLCQRLDNEGGW